MILLRQSIWYSKYNLDFLKEFKSGWGNGYVIIPRTHPFWGLDYDDPKLSSIVVHGGLTYMEDVHRLYRYSNIESEPDFISQIEKLPLEYRGGWALGFDTAHFGDTPELWPKERVMEEALKLKKQLDEIGNMALYQKPV